VAQAAAEQRALDRVVLMVSRRALAKEEVEHPRLEHRLDVLHDAVSHLEWLSVSVTDRQLLADVAEGFEVLIMGADKWHQIQQLRWYEDARHRTEALERLPELAIAPRPPLDVEPRHMLQMDVEATGAVSSTAARQGAVELMVPAARRFAEESGAWLNAEKYNDWLTHQSG